MPERTKPQTQSAVYGVGAEYLPESFGELTPKIIRQMRKDPTIALARALVQAPILASGWSYEQDESAPDEAREFIEKNLEPMRLHILRTALQGGIDFGWQPYEKVFELDEQRRVYLRKLKPLLQDFTTVLIVKENGAFNGLRQGTLDLDLASSLLLSFDVEGTDWHGNSYMAAARDPWAKWGYIEKAATKYDQKVAGSHWVVHYPPGTSLYGDGNIEIDNFEIAKKLLTQLEASGAIAVPQTTMTKLDDLNEGLDEEDAWKIELLSDTSSARAHFIDRQKYLDAQKVRAFRVPERAVIEGEFGTKAEAEAHADFAITHMELRHSMIVQEINWHLVNQILRFNWGPQYENTVWIQAAPITDLAIQYLRKLYSQILGNETGLLDEIPRIDRQALRDRLNIPTLADDEIEDITVVRPQIQETEQTTDGPPIVGE